METIKRYQLIPAKCTRREFGSAIVKGAGVAALAGILPARAHADDPAFTVAVVPDPQYLAGNAPCSSTGSYGELIRWAVENSQLPVNGVPLNIKGFIQVGDCQNVAYVDTQNDQATVMVNAWQQAIDANKFVAFCCGNHDYETNGAAIDRHKISYVWRTDKNGPWRPEAISQFYGSGMDLGGGDAAFWGGAYSDEDGFPHSSANNFMRLKIGSRKILIISLEFFPRNGVMNWAKSIHDLYADHECWITTHGYMDNYSARSARAQLYGPNSYGLLDDGTSNSGEQMFTGNLSSPTHPGIANFPRARVVTCGHFIDGWSDGWIWQHNTATGAAGQKIEEIYANAQGSYGTGDTQLYCGGNPLAPIRTLSTAHLMLLRIRPSSMEAFMVSTNAGKWIGSRGVILRNSPVQLWDVPFQPLPPSRQRGQTTSS